MCYHAPAIHMPTPCVPNHSKRPKWRNNGRTNLQMHTTYFSSHENKNQRSYVGDALWSSSPMTTVETNINFTQNIILTHCLTRISTQSKNPTSFSLFKALITMNEAINYALACRSHKKMPRNLHNHHYSTRNPLPESESTINFPLRLIYFPKRKCL